jgi:hypothetical protein
VSGYTVAGFIHVLLVIALAVLLFQLLTGRQSIPRPRPSPPPAGRDASEGLYPIGYTPGARIR